MLTEEGVAAAYQLLLGRLPESDALVRRYVEHASFDSLRKAILGSVEFADRVATQPDAANLHPSLLGSCPATRLGCRQLEHLASLGLPVWGRTVLCPGGGSGLIPSFFVDRFCQVVVPIADAERAAATKTHLRRVRRTTAIEGPDVRHLDLSSLSMPEDIDPWDIVASYGSEMPPKRIESFLANLAHACANILVLEIEVSFGGANVFSIARRTVDGSATEIAVPTRRWVWSALARDFAHVYVPRTQPCHEDYTLIWDGSERDAATSRAIFVAARSDLAAATLSPTLLDVQTMQL